MPSPNTLARNSDGVIYPDPPRFLSRLSPRHLIRYLGPGVIIASVTIGNGELVWASRSGAIFGYTLLWCFLYAGTFKAIQVYSAARHITLTGEHPLATWARLPGPPMWFPLLIVLPAVMLMPVAFSALPETLGGFVHRTIGLALEGADVGPWEHFEWWENVWGTAVLALCTSLAVRSSYALVERVSAIVLGTLMLCVGVSVIVYQPALGELIRGLFVPGTPTYPNWVLAAPYAEEFGGRTPWLEISVYLTAVGGGAYDYIGYIGMLREKQWGVAVGPPISKEELTSAVTGQDAKENCRRARVWCRAPLLDATLSFFFVILVTLLFAILGTVVLHSAEVIPRNTDLLTQQERFLHPNLAWLYRVAVLLAFLGTLYGAFAVYRHTFLESLSVIAPRWRQRWTEKRWGHVIFCYCVVGGLTMVWLPKVIAGDIVGRITFGSLLSGATSCGLWCFVMLWTNHVRLPKELRMGRIGWLLVLASGVGMTLLGLQTIIAYFTS